MSHTSLWNALRPLILDMGHEDQLFCKLTHYYYFFFFYLIHWYLHYMTSLAFWQWTCSEPLLGLERCSLSKLVDLFVNARCLCSPIMEAPTPGNITKIETEVCFLFFFYLIYLMIVVKLLWTVLLTLPCLIRSLRYG